MKNISILFLSLFLLMSPSMAINWVELQSLTGKQVYLDKDSITKKNNYYFYNIRFIDDANKEVVTTVQSGVFHPFSSIIRNYTISEYNSLGGDYDNQLLNSTSSLKPVAYESRVFASYREVARIMQEKNKPQITF